MTYSEFCNQPSFSREHLIAFSYGRLVSDPPEHFDARLPAPPFLMMDRILSLEKEGAKGKIVAEQDIEIDAWYFQCHFPGDPVQPGCLGLDALWQLMGFYGVWRGGLGAGRALGCDAVSFNGQIRPFSQVVRFEIDVLRYSELKTSGACLLVGNGRAIVEGDIVITVKNARVGLFRDIVYTDYPMRTPRSVGGLMH